MIQKNVANVHLVGIDDGRAEVKLYAGQGKQFKIRTAVLAGVHASSIGNISGGGESGTYETDGVSYTAGHDVDGEDTRFEDFDGSPINRVAIHHALIKAGFEGEKVKIATGLPVSANYLSGQINKSAVNSKRAKIQQPVISLNPSIQTSEILSNIIIAEGVAAFLDDRLDEDGNLVNDGLSGPVGVVDFGGRTIDTVWMRSVNEIDHRHSGSEEIGVLDLYDLVENGLRAKYPNLGSFTREQLESAVKTKSVRLFGKPHDVAEIVKEGISEIQSRIDREIQRRFGGASSLERILFVGGGSAAIPGIAERYPNAVMVKDPEFANARGMYKMLKHLQVSQKG